MDNATKHRHLGSILKLLMMIVIYTTFYLLNSYEIDQVFADPQKSYYERAIEIGRIALGVQSPVNNDTSLDTYDSLAFPGNTVPITLPVELEHVDAYHESVTSANVLNDSLDPSLLNDYFTDLVNARRQDVALPIVETGEHLASGAYERTLQLGQYHYLSNETIDGSSFRVLFNDIMESPEYRLGENLYELFIAANDIHVTTWQNERILAEYLFEVFSNTITNNDYSEYQYQYLSVRADATDYQIAETPYIRIVVSLITDLGY